MPLFSICLSKNEVELDTTLTDEKNNAWSLLSKDMERQNIKEAIDKLPDVRI